jgi:hypothetical protein
MSGLPVTLRNAMPLSATQQNAVLLFCEGQAAADVARAVGVTPRTVSRWMRRPEFVQALTEQRAALRSEVVNRLHTEADRAVRVVAGIMNNTAVHPAVRLKAAQDILDRVTGQAQLDELTARVAEMERLLDETENTYQ